MIAFPATSVPVFDIGGSRVSAALCQSYSFAHWSVVCASHTAEHRSDAFLHFLHAIGLQASVGCGEVCGSKLAVPGLFEFGIGKSRMRHTLSYPYGFHMRQELARQFCWRPNQIRSLCDAAAFLLDEIGAGMARGVRRAVGITMGAGIGLVRAVDGRAVTEWPGFPPGGEMWNLPCSGRQVEDFISSRAIQNH